MAGHTVLAPHSEMSTALLDALERSFHAQGRDIWPTPHVRDLRGWLRELHAQQQLESGGLPRCLSDFEERELWRGIIAADSSVPQALDPASAARLAQRARRSVLEYAIPWRAVAAHDATETQIFLGWNKAFDERCRALNCCDVDSLLDRIEVPSQPISWVDSPSWRPAARGWLARHGQPLLPPIVAHSAVFKLHAASPDAEMAAAADWARRRLASGGHFRAWVCVPDLPARRADVIDAFDAALAPHRFELAVGAGSAPYAIAGGTPLADYAPVRIALEILDAVPSAITFARFSALLRSPYMQDCDQEQSNAAMLDVELRERAPSEASLAAWLQICEEMVRSAARPPPAALSRLRAIHGLFMATRGTRRFSEWLPVWLAALDQGPWLQPARWSSVEYQAVERFRELLTALASADAFFGTHSHQSGLRVLRRAAGETSFQPQTGIPPVWVSGQVADPWLGYDGLWVGGLSADAWPAPVETVALLPVQLQREYAVPAASFETQLRTAAQLQQRWVQRASECVFSHADAAAGGRGSAPSPLLPVGASILHAAHEAPPTWPHWRMQHASAPALERYVDELAPPFAAGERTRGVASLRAQSLCAFRGFAETRLRADGFEQPTPGFNERERGQLVHHALEHVWSVLRDSDSLHALTPEAQRELLTAGAERAVQLTSARRDPGPTWRRRECKRLVNLLGKWLDTERLRQPFAVEWLEQRAQFRSAGLEFNLRIDRADRLMQDGARVLIDYKTGVAGADWRGERPDNPQLPVYALLSPQDLTAVAYGNVNAAEPCFVCESERPGTFRPGAKATALEGLSNMAALLEVWSARILTLASALAAGQAEVAPTATACRLCRLHGLCRVPSSLEDAHDDFS